VTLTIACALAGELDERGLVNGNELQHGMCSGLVTPEKQQAENISQFWTQKRCDCPCHLEMNERHRRRIQRWVLRRSITRETLPWHEWGYEF
jgi:hypothetical protein